jgi:hypothetical protein
MKTRARAKVFAAGVAVFLAGIATIVFVGRGATAAPPAVGPLAVVLVPAGNSSELVVADVGARSVVRRIRLRSLATDVAVESSTGVVVTAQAGGVGETADHVLGVADPRSGDVRYVDLGCPNPGDVACVRGRAIVLHGIVDESGMVVTAVDVATSRIVGRGHAPDGPGIWTAGPDSVFTAGGAVDSTAAALVRLRASDLVMSRVAPAGTLNGVATEESGSLLLLRGGDASSASPAVERLSSTGSFITSGPVTGLVHGARMAVRVGDLIVVGDWSGSSPESDRLAVLDARTLQGRGTIVVGGAPCALAAAGDRLVVVDRLGGTLRIVDPVTRRVTGSIDLRARDLAFAKVVVMPR